MPEAATPWRREGRRRAVAANVLFLLAVFPYLKIVPGLTSEVQPIGGLVGIGVWLLFAERGHIHRAFVPLLGVIATYAAASAFQLATAAGFPNAAATLEALAILTAPIGLAIGLATVLDNLSVRLVTWCVCGWTLLGTAQVFAADGLRAVGVTGLLSTVIPRLSTAPQAVGGRGVTMFAPEPSYAAASILLMLVAWLWLARSGRLTNRRRAAVGGLLTWMILLNSSVSLFVSLLLLAVATVLAAALFRRVLLLPALIAVALSLVILASFQSSTVRPLRVAAQISSAITSGSFNADQLLRLSQENGSGRLQSVLQGYRAASINSGAGLGLPFWGTWVAPVASDTPLLEPRQKPYSYGSFAAMVLGVPGLAALAYAVAFLGRRILKGRVNPIEVGTVCVALLGIIANSPASLPTYWVMFIFALPTAALKGSMQDRAAQRAVYLLPPPPITERASQLEPGR